MVAKFSETTFDRRALMSYEMLSTWMTMAAGAALVWVICGCSSRTSSPEIPPATAPAPKVSLPPEVEAEPAAATQRYLKNKRQP